MATRKPSTRSKALSEKPKTTRKFPAKKATPAKAPAKKATPVKVPAKKITPKKPVVAKSTRGAEGVGNINIRIPDSMKTRFNALSLESGRTMSGMGFFLIKQYIDKMDAGAKPE